MEEITELLNCSICMETFTDPRVLQCQHIFCCQCLTDYIDGKRKSSNSILHSFSCPLCRSNVSLKRASANGESFPKCLTVASLLHIVHQSRDHQSEVSSVDKGCQATPTLKSCITLTVRKQTRQQSVQASTGVKTFNTRSQTENEKPMRVKQLCKKTQTTLKLTRRQNPEFQIDMKHTSTQTEQKCDKTKTTKEENDSSWPPFIWIFHIVEDKWDLVFNRTFDNLIEKFIIRYIIVTISDDRPEGEHCKGLAFCCSRLFCILCLMFYILFMVFISESKTWQGYIFITIILCKLLQQILTINLKAYPGYVMTDTHNQNFLFLHVVWFWAIFLFLCLLLYILCLSVTIGGHPSQTTECFIENGFVKECNDLSMDYPDISFIMRNSLSKFDRYLCHLFDFNLSHIAGDFNRHVIKGEPLHIIRYIYTDKHTYVNDIFDCS